MSNQRPSARITDQTSPSAGGSDRTPLTKSEIIAAATRLIDTGGMGAFTMRSLANDLNVYPATLYWHAGSKADLLAAVSSRIFDEVALPDEHQADWTSWLIEVARRCRAAMHAHPEIAQIAGSQMVVSATAVPLIERILGVLEKAGFTGQSLVGSYNAYVGFVLGWVNLELASEPAAGDVDWRTNFKDELGSLDQRAYPVVTRYLGIIEDNIFMARFSSGRHRPMNDSFEVAARILMRGLQGELGMGSEPRDQQH